MNSNAIASTRLLMYFRTEIGFAMYAYSDDQGRSWSEPEKHAQLHNADTKSDMINLRDEAQSSSLRGLLFIYNDHRYSSANDVTLICHAKDVLHSQ